MIADKKPIPLNNENKIRDILVNKYINNPTIKKAIEFKYFILPEIPESTTTGRTDIRIFSPNTFYNQDEYFTIECKRLDNQACQGVSGLNFQYIKNGIQRFTSGFYSSYFNINAMIGFVVEKLDIDKNVDDINCLLNNNFKEINTIRFLKNENFIDDFKFHYSSMHLTKGRQTLKLYHLMFPFAK